MSWSWQRSLIVTAVIVAVFVAYRVYSELAGAGFEERLKRIEGDAKKSLPMKLDDVTTLVDLKYNADKTTYWYVMDVASLRRRQIRQRRSGRTRIKTPSGASGSGDLVAFLNFATVSGHHVSKFWSF
jgi:hypothetical protein